MFDDHQTSKATVLESGNKANIPVSGQRSRYRMVQHDEERFIVCGDTKNIHLHIISGLSVTEAARKRYPSQTIFLDGVFAGPPFYDNHSRQYSLDHHMGCVRAFTLATCEQAVVMLLQGLPLSEGEWNVYINQPDLDALLASWILLNHIELLSDNAILLRKVMPLVRVEGIIDAHGLDREILSALPPEIYQAKKRSIDRLREKEKQHTAEGSWDTLDVVQYSLEILEALDHLNYSDAFLHHLQEIEEIQRLPLGDNRMVILCRSNLDIYDVEALLKDRYERQLGLIILDRGRGRFTLRQVDPFLDKDLRTLYRVLNQRDLWARLESEAENAWGGSDDIGGSPRKTGSALSGEEILDIAHQVYTKSESWLNRLMHRNR